MDASRTDPTGPEALLAANVALIGRIIRYTARRHRLSQVEAEDFGSIVYVHLIENDYAVLRKFKRRCKLQTFLTVVITRVCLDYRTQEWGRWRPSAEARRLGAAAVEFERLVGRDHFSVEQAVVSVESKGLPVPPSAALGRLASRLLAKPRRRRLSSGTEAIAREMSMVPDREPLPSTLAARRELQQHAARIRHALARLLRTFDPQDRRLIDLRFNHGLGIAQIARALQVDQRPLYGRLSGLLARLRRGLEGDPATARVIPELLSESGNEPWRP